MGNYTAKRIKEFLTAANSDLGSGKHEPADMMVDYAKAVIIGQQLQKQLAEAEGEIEDVRLELSTPLTMEMRGEPLHEWAAAIICDYKAQLTALREQLIQMCRVFHAKDCVCKWCNIVKERAAKPTCETCGGSGEIEYHGRSQEGPYKRPCPDCARKNK